MTGVAGGAASGKTTVCDMIIQQLHDQRVVLVNQVLFQNDCNLLRQCLIAGQNLLISSVTNVRSFIST